MFIFCDLIQVFVFTTKYHLKREIFKGLWNTFEENEWNIRDIGIQSVLGVQHVHRYIRCLL